MRARDFGLLTLLPLFYGPPEIKELPARGFSGNNLGKAEVFSTTIKT